MSDEGRLVVVDEPVEVVLEFFESGGTELLVSP